jgi:transcriptional regulator with GAF, ATPase, and Fis domain
VSDGSSPSSRETLAATTFVELIDTLVDEFDVVDLLTVLASRCVELLDAGAAGILLADEGRRLRVVAASDEQIQLLELFQVQNDEGPCLDCVQAGSIVVAPDLRADRRWPRFAPQSTAAGWPSVCAVPLRLKDRTLGCLNLFMSAPGSLSAPDIALAQALADVATIAMMQDEAIRTAAIREGQLQHALQSRIAIEQAKGMIAEGAGVDMDAAFARLRQFSRNNNRRLTEVAQSLVGGVLTVESVVASTTSVPPPRRRP